jgi:hypothetical protein
MSVDMNRMTIAGLVLKHSSHVQEEFACFASKLMRWQIVERRLYSLPQKVKGGIGNM